MQAYVEGGLLDKVLKTEPGDTLQISMAEARGLITALHGSLLPSAYELVTNFLREGKGQFLGRTIKIS